MKHGSIWTLSIGVTGGPSKTTMIGTFPLKKVLQRVHTGSKNDVFVKS